MTKLQVTLKDLRANHACVSGYNKLVCALTDQEFDEERETYIRYRHDEPISIEYILNANGLDDALWALRAVKNADRDCRHYAVWCAREVQHLMTDPHCIHALDVAERYADGQATDDELKAARAATWKIARAAERATAWEAAWDAAWDAQADMLRKMCRGEALWQVAK